MSNRYGGQRLKRGFGHFVVWKTISAGSGFFAMVLVVRLLPIHEFAHYSVLISLVELFSSISALGLAHALIRYVPELYALHYKKALQQFVLGAIALRSSVMLLAIGLTYIWASSLAPLIGMAEFIDAFRLFLFVVLFRTTNNFMSQILESTLNQGYSQFAFSVTSVTRFLGMLYLTQIDHADLLNIILVEMLSEILGTIIMIIGTVQIVWRATQEKFPPEGDSGWLNKNLNQIAHFALMGYIQHIAGLPFGGTTNRLVGGYLFTSPMMASFGFAQSLYEYIKRYLPAQLLVGLIRPVVVARFCEKRDFSSAAKIGEQVIQLNTAIIGGIFSALAVGGHEMLTFLSDGKYGINTLWVLITLLVVLALETHRLILEMMVQTVERYAILIPSNITLSLSIIPAIILFPYLGAIGFPMINAVMLVFSNLWVKRQLDAEGYTISHQWYATMQLFILMLVTIILGRLLTYNGIHWLISMGVAVIAYLIGTWKLRGRDMKNFVADLMAR